VRSSSTAKKRQQQAITSKPKTLKFREKKSTTETASSRFDPVCIPKLWEAATLQKAKHVEPAICLLVALDF
jgi:hypothetical protein